MITESVRTNPLEYLKWMEKIKSVHYTDNDAMSRAIESLNQKNKNGINTTSTGEIEPIIILFRRG